MLILSLDTCNAHGSAALLRDGSVLQCAVHETGEEYSIWLPSAMEGLLRAESAAWKDIDFFAVVTGPGSFTGLRVGLATAKGFAEVYGKKIAAVPRLEAVASRASEAGEWVAVAVEGGRGEVYSALYRRAGGELQREGQECVLSAEEFLSRVARAVPGGGVVWCTPGTERIAALEGWAARVALGDKLESAEEALAPAAGKMGYALARAGRLVDALALNANYIRRPDAERFWEEARAGSHAR